MSTSPSLFKSCVLITPHPQSTKKKPMCLYLHVASNGDFELVDRMKGAATFNQEDAEKVIAEVPDQKLTMLPVE